MDQVNINAPPPVEPPPRPPSRWPLYAFITIIAVLLIGGTAVAALRRNNQAAANPTPTPAAPVATSTPATAGGATATPAASGGGSTATPGSGGSAQKPTNPTAMQVSPGSCTDHHIKWTWSGAQRATSYDVVIYNPQSGAIVRDTHVHGASYDLGAGPGATVALKVRSRNAAGTAPNYFTPGDVGRVPTATTNPTNMTVTVTGHTITWFWTGAQNAAAYDVVVYHYSGGAAKDDITARTTVPHWGTKVTPGVTYYLRVHAIGSCGPAAFYTPSRPGKAGA